MVISAGHLHQRLATQRRIRSTFLSRVRITHFFLSAVELCVWQVAREVGERAAPNPCTHAKSTWELQARVIHVLQATSQSSVDSRNDGMLSARCKGCVPNHASGAETTLTMSLALSSRYSRASLDLVITDMVPQIPRERKSSMARIPTPARTDPHEYQPKQLRACLVDRCFGRKVTFAVTFVLLTAQASPNYLAL